MGPLRWKKQMVFFHISIGPTVSIRLVRSGRWNPTSLGSVDEVCAPILRDAEEVEDPLTDILSKISPQDPWFQILEVGVAKGSGGPPPTTIHQSCSQYPLDFTTGAGVGMVIASHIGPVTTGGKQLEFCQWCWHQWGLGWVEEARNMGGGGIPIRIGGHYGRVEESFTCGG